MMQQVPFPPPGVDLNFLVRQLIPLVGAIAALIVGARLLHWVFRSPIGEAIAETIRARRRRRWGMLEGEEGARDEQRVAALEDQVAALQGQVAELAERLDFAERVLAERREHRLGAGT